MRSAYTPHERVRAGPFGPTMTKQSMQDECDINILMKKYEKTGMIDHVIRYKGQYADVTSQLDYQEALHTIMDAQSMFASLPASVRDRFGNSPEHFLKFVEDPANETEMRKMGLMDTPYEEPSTPPETPPPAAPTTT